MDLQTILTQVESWSLADRLRLRDGFLDQGHEHGLTEGQAAEALEQGESHSLQKAPISTLRQTLRCSPLCKKLR